MDWILRYQFFVLLGVVAAAAAVLGWQIFVLRKRINRTFGTRDASAAEIAAEALERAEKIESSLDALRPRLSTLEEISKISVQKMGFLRFNPFRDTGGDQSFVLAMLDRENNGVILSSLYTREGARVYAKSVSGGATKYQLSAEEKKVLEETIQRESGSKNHEL